MIKDTSNPPSLLSGSRFHVTYRILGNEADAYSKASDICIEQTIEFPGDLVPEDGIIKGHIIGRIESFEPYDAESFKAIISYAIEITANELTQLLNVIFGNISIKPGIRVEQIEMPPSFLRLFKGPRFGIEGILSLLNISKGPLLSTALKPMGLSSQELADLAYQFALGGIDVIKDDHGITNQCLAPFEERVSLCAAAVKRANMKTGRKSIYMANVTAASNEVFKRARIAKEAGAAGLLAAPGLIGFDLMRQLSDDDSIALPVFCHPSFLGSFVTSMNGIAHQVIFGQFPRLAGADAIIYPNFGGRFSFSIDECRDIVKGASISMGHLKPIFPVPGGGMSLNRIPDMFNVYGQDVIFLIGGDLFRHGHDLVKNCRSLCKLLEQAYTQQQTARIKDV